MVQLSGLTLVQMRTDVLCNSAIKFARLLVVSAMLLTIIMVPGRSFGATNLIFLHHLDGTLARDLDSLMAEISSKYDAEVDMVIVSDRELVEKAIVMAAGGLMPDLIRVDQAQIRALTVAGLLEDLTPYIAKDGVDLRRDFIPLSAEAFAHRGMQYAIPAEISSNATFYNRPMFDAAGLPYPSTDWNSNQWTWDDMVVAARLLTADASGTGARSSYGINPPGHVYFWPWIWGADWISEDLTEFHGDKEGVVQALDRLVELRQEGLFGGSFLHGTSALLFEGNWTLNTLKQKSYDDLDWDLAVFPLGSHRSVSLLPNGFAISRSSQNKEIAWEIIKELTLKDSGVQRYTDIVNRIPSHRAHWSYYLDSQEILFPGKQNHVLLDALILGFGRIWTIRFSPNWPIIDNSIRSAWDSAWRGEKSVAHAMAEIAPYVNTLLREGRLVESP